MAAPAHLTIVCPACPPGAGGTLLSLAADATDVRCPACRKRFRVVTRQVKSSSSQRIDRQRSTFEVLTFERDERARPRRFVAPANVRLNPNVWVTLVYRGVNLVGIADQTASFWYPVAVLPVRRSARRRLREILSAACLLLVGVQAVRVGPSLSDILRRPVGVATLTVALLFLAAPAVLWALKTGWGGQRRGYLPLSTSAQDEKL